MKNLCVNLKIAKIINAGVSTLGYLNSSRKKSGVEVGIRTLDSLSYRRIYDLKKKGSFYGLLREPAEHLYT